MEANQQLYHDTQFFANAGYNPAGYPSTGLTPYFNGANGDPNLFDQEYGMHQGNQDGYMSAQYDMSNVGNPQTDMDGMTFNPQMLGKGAREYSASSSETNDTASASPQEQLRRRLPARNNEASESSGTGNSPADETSNSAKRNKFLERNRLAAAKCRTKKKEWTNNLEAAARQASQQTRELHAIVQNLRNEVLEHKAQLMSHQGCDCHDIHDYLSHYGINQ